MLFLISAAFTNDDTVDVKEEENSNKRISDVDDS